YMTLTHSESLDWADSATGDVRHNGLTPFGEQVVAEMNRLGMLVDLSHVTPAVMKQTLAISKAPVIFSHSSARGVADHPRNVPDDVLPLVADNGGVVMVNFYSAFVVPEGAARDVNRLDYRRQITAELVDSEDRDREVDALLARWDDAHPATRGSIHDVIDHIDHIVMLAGIDHVGLGSDYDGVSLLPQQLEDASCYPYITQALLDRGYSDQDVRQILGRNAVRALRDAEAVSRELRKRDSK
ncbi:MAG: membrane dipeptidase, partial [Planctomycetota bacterium]